MYLVALRLGNTTQLSFPSFPDTEIALRLGPTGYGPRLTRD